MRMIPINTERPKALLEVDGVPLIERLIHQLHEAEIFRITVVVGYHREQFAYLETKYQVELVDNPDYIEKNNLHSMALVKDRISNSFIIPCDIWCLENPFLETYDQSCYLMYDRNEGVEENRPYWNSMTGIAFLAAGDYDKFKSRLSQLESLADYQESFWEEILYDGDHFLLKIRKASETNIYQINTYEDLRRLDSQSKQLKSEIIEIICQTFGVTDEDISEIKALKKGMTNRSFLFSCSGQKYIMRIPGEGTDLLINRKEETAVYQALAGTAISDRILYINPDNGYKITEFLDGARTCNPENKDDLEACMVKLRQFHQLGLVVEHEFDLFAQLDFYEGLRQGVSSRYGTYDAVKSMVYELKPFVDSHVEKKILSHIDAIADNFLILENSNQAEVFLIDWEYAGMQDPHVDLAMFSIYSYYTRSQIDELMSIYFEADVSEVLRMKIYAYVAICGLLWSNWCEYKSLIGVEFGDYADRQYRYAQEYSQIVLDFLSGKS